MEAALGLFKHQQAAHDTHKKNYDQAHQLPSYNIGNLVLLNNARRAQRKVAKLAPRWTGPQKIVEIRDKGVVRLEGKKALTNMTRIKPYNQQSSIPSADEPLTSSQPTIATHKTTLTRQFSTDSSCDESRYQPPPTLIYNSVNKDSQ